MSAAAYRVAPDRVVFELPGGRLVGLPLALAWAVLPLAQASEGNNLASVAVITGPAADVCEDVRPLRSDAGPPNAAWWEGGPEVDIALEAVTAFPALNQRRAETWAAVLSCRPRAISREEPPLVQRALLFARAPKQRLEVIESVVIGDHASRLEAAVPFVADADGDGRPELGLKGTIVEERGPERIEGEAEVFVFFAGSGRARRAPDAAHLIVHKRARRSFAREDGTLERSGIAGRLRAAGKVMFLDRAAYPAADEAALDRWWESSSGDDVFDAPASAERFRWNGARLETLGRATSPDRDRRTWSGTAAASVRTIAQTGDGELSIEERGQAVDKVAFRGRIARVARDNNHLYAAVYVAEHDEARELYLVDLTTARVRKLPRREGQEIALWSWSPDGSFAISSSGAEGPLSLYTVKELETWISTGNITPTEARLTRTPGARVSFVRWIGTDTFEAEVNTGGRTTHYRYDARTRRAIKLYELRAE